MKYTLAAAMMAGVAGGIAPATAAPVTYFFEAVISEDRPFYFFDDPTGQLAANGIAPGVPVTGSFTYDTEAALQRTAADGLSAFYEGPTEISASFAGVEVTGRLGPGSRAFGHFVSNESTIPLFVDEFEVAAGAAGGPPDLTGLSYNDGFGVSVRVVDPTGAAFSDLSIPASLSLSDCVVQVQRHAGGGGRRPVLRRDYLSGRRAAGRPPAGRASPSGHGARRTGRGEAQDGSRQRVTIARVGQAGPWRAQRRFG
jgi:hypothetical protein